MDNRTPAEKLAFTLRYLIDKGCVPGLLPKDVEAAAELLVEQERELAEARRALATKHHIVEATAKSGGYHTKISGTFIIADPRIYRGEIEVDDALRYIGRDQNDWQFHVARRLTRAATEEWIREMEESAFGAVRTALAAAARSAETVKQGSA